MPQLIDIYLMASTNTHAIPTAPEYSGPCPARYFINLRLGPELYGQPI